MKERLGCIGIFLVVILLAIIIIFNFAYAYNKTTTEGIVTEKLVKNYDEKGLYLVFIEDGNGNTEQLCVKDSLLNCKFDASERYQQIKEGHKYKFECIGYRINIFSKYKNILKSTEIKE